LSPVTPCLLSVDRLFASSQLWPTYQTHGHSETKDSGISVVGGSGGRCFCRRALITLVTPLHWSGSANAADSVCLYKKQERALRCQPIIWPRPTAGLCISRIWRPVGNRVLSSRSQPVFRCTHHITTALETQPLPAVSRAYPPTMSTNCPAASDGDGQRFRPVVWGPISHCASPVVPPLCSSLPGRFVTFWACHRLLCQSIDGVPASAGNSNSDHVGKKVRTLAKSRVSIKTRELRLSTRECNFLGINIPNYNTSIFCFLNYYWILFTIADKTNYKLFQEEGIHQMV